jgi:hypothetical protein
VMREEMKDKLEELKFEEAEYSKVRVYRLL